MQMYDKKLNAGGTLTALSLAIFDAEAKTLKYVDMPDNVSAIGKTIYARNGYVYIPISFTEGYPIIYRIDPKTAVATKGLTVEVTSIESIGLLNPID